MPEPHDTIERWIVRQREPTMLAIIAEELLQDTCEELEYTKDKPAMNKLRRAYKAQVEIVSLEM